MGYDMMVRDPGEEAVAKQEELRQEFLRVVAEADGNKPAGQRERRPEDQAKVDEAADAMFGADLTSFRLNIWGMAEMRPVLEAAGVLDVVSDHGPFPDVSGMEGFDAEEGEHTGAAAEAMDGFLSQRSPEEGKVPIFKFGSNDGWIVTPEECLLIGNALKIHLTRPGVVEELNTPDNDEWASYVARFGAFNLYAAEHGGYEVW